MSNPRFLFHLSVINDPDVIAAGAEKLLAHGCQVKALGSHLWRCGPNPEGYCRAAVLYMPPGHPLPPGWAAGPRRDVLQLCYSASPDAPRPTLDPDLQNDCLLRSLRCTLVWLITGAVLVALLLANRLVLMLDDLLYGLSSGYELAFTLLLAEGLCLCLFLAVRIFRRMAQLRRAKAQGAPPPPPPRVSPVPEGIFLVLFVLTTAAVVWHQPLLLALLAAAAVVTAATLPLRRHLVARGRSQTFAQVAGNLLVTAAVVAVLAGWSAATLQGWVALPGSTLPVGQYTRNGYTVSVYDDPLPLTVEAMTGEQAHWTKQRTYRHSVLVQLDEYEQRALNRRGLMLHYRVIDTPLPPLYDRLKQSLLDAHWDQTQPDGAVFLDSYHPADPTPWGADAVYRLSWGSGPLDNYLVCWPGRMVEIAFSWSPTTAQIRTAAQALRPQ